MGLISQKLCSTQRCSLTSAPIPKETVHASKKAAPNHAKALRCMGDAILPVAYVEGFAVLLVSKKRSRPGGLHWASGRLPLPIQTIWFLVRDHLPKSRQSESAAAHRNIVPTPVSASTSARTHFEHDWAVFGLLIERWSGGRDSNSRSPGPKPGALPS